MSDHTITLDPIVRFGTARPRFHFAKYIGDECMFVGPMEARPGLRYKKRLICDRKAGHRGHHYDEGEATFWGRAPR